jgi:hypothetical protein
MMVGTRRLTRLENDHKQMTAMHERGGLIYVIAVDGNPPERYVVGFRCRGIAAIDDNDRPVLRDDHRVELALTIDYPRVRPVMRWLTPIFHPNFDNYGRVCLEHWYSQQTLSELCEVLAELVQYKNYNTTSPLNMDAAMWAMRHREELPIDDRSLFTPLTGQTAPEPVAQSVYQASVVVTGTLPIWSPPQESASAKDLGCFCGNCGYEFPDARVHVCPQCGAERTIIGE